MIRACAQTIGVDMDHFPTLLLPLDIDDDDAEQ